MAPIQEAVKCWVCLISSNVFILGNLYSRPSLLICMTRNIFPHKRLLARGGLHLCAFQRHEQTIVGGQHLPQCCLDHRAPREEKNVLKFPLRGGFAASWLWYTNEGKRMILPCLNGEALFRLFVFAFPHGKNCLRFFKTFLFKREQSIPAPTCIIVKVFIDFYDSIENRKELKIYCHMPGSLPYS